jgi:hypothetical protein
MPGLNRNAGPSMNYGGNPYNIDPNAKDYASQNYAALTRDMWASWTSNFLPFENDLIEYASDPNVVAQAQQRASEGVNQAFDAQRGATQRRLKGLGLTLSADEQESADRSYGLARSLADVTAQNVAGTRTRERQQSVLGNPAPQI